MSATKGKVKPARFDTVPENKLVMRFVDVHRETLNESARSVKVVVATENPVQRYDEERGIIVNEVLTMDGLRLRGGRTQLPIVDSHDRSTVANVLGSVRNLRVEGDELVGDAFFASDAASQEAFTKLNEGHLTDFSITASPNEIGFVERGKQYTTRSGMTVDGPADIVTSWMPTDASLVASGADVRSTVRRSYEHLPLERQMDEALLAPLIAMGLPEGLTDVNAVLAWVAGNMAAKEPEAAAAVEPIESELPMAEEVPAEEEEVVNAEGEDEEEIAKAEDDEEEIENAKRKVDRALKEERKRCAEIYAVCSKAGIERADADAFCKSGVSLDVVRKKVLERMSASNSAIGQSVSDVRVTESSDDKFYNAVRDGLVSRAYAGAGLRAKVAQPAPGAEDFKYVGLRRLSERFVARMGVNVDKLAPKDIALIAMGHPGAMNRHNIQREAYHSTGSFANLMLDASNKTLLAAYEEAPYTWNIWARQASSVADFKAINRIRFSESPDPEHVPENHKYPEGKMSDNKESYKVEKYGSLFSVTWETVVNDDLDAISRIPAMQGTACRRKQNAAVYGVLTANAAMADTGALFNTTAVTTAGGHANQASSGGALSVSTLNTAFTSMMTKRGVGATGLGDGPILNLQPAYLIIPVAVSATAMQIIGSIADPSNAAASTEDASRPNYNSNVINIYGPNGGRPLQIVADAVLDGNSSTAWYLAARNQQIDTVELSFLQGEESPVLENEWDFDHDCYKYKVRQTFGVAAIDWRGLYKNAGA